jgi:hypothetical protein
VAACAVLPLFCGVVQAGAENALGMQLVQVPAGTFSMGSESGDWDEQPVREVVLSRPFLIGAAEVSLAQFQRFRPEHRRSSPEGAAIGMSWHDAVAFCEWLSRQEGEPYRLPTEAEWEFACRLSGGGPDDRAVEAVAAVSIGIAGMGNETPEWCLDWYGPYADGPQTDPVGPDGGLARVVRGNKLDVDTHYMLPHTTGTYYQRSANRAGMAPAFGAAGPNEHGAHNIGFRVVQAAMPATRPHPQAKEPIFLGVKQRTADAARTAGPPKQTPYFGKRYLLPTPPETLSAFSAPEAVEAHTRKMTALNLHPAFRGHNHSPALEVLPNGDLLMVIFTSWNEYEPGMSLMATRLRYGADQWDMPSYFLDMPDACDNTPLLWTEGARVRLFWSSTRAVGGFPFNWIESEDSGASWSEVHFPVFTTEAGPHSRQPISTALRDRDGIVYVSSDGDDATSVLWVSRDGLKTWQDLGGRTGGRHTVFTLLQDRKTILGMGGKSSDINGYMPQSVSDNEGKTWQVSATPFPAYGSNQRPSLLRLASGRLFFSGDFQRVDGVAPDTIDDRGAFVALSDDEGVTWHVKKLQGAQPHENPVRHDGADTIGYSVARQAPDGLIHLITTMNTPCLHFAMNEAWILAPDNVPGATTLMANSASAIADVQRYEERYTSGGPRVVWHAGIGDDGRYLLHGQESWYHEDGGKMYQASYELGRKAGEEVFYRADGSQAWGWRHHGDGISQWTQWWPDGAMRSQSHWRDFHAHGPARRWDRDGHVIVEANFTTGEIE